MTSAASILRSLIVYGLCLPLAIFLGYLLASPQDLTTVFTLLLLLGALAAPILLRWHHPLMIVTWNMSAVIFFLPGSPPLWMGMVAMSLGIAVLQFALNRDRRFLSVPSLTWPLILLAVVVMVTADLSGGLGLKAFGAQSNGGKRYFLVMGAIVGYFALTSRRIAPDRAVIYVVLFFLGGVTMAVGSLAGTVSPAFYFLFLIFPVEDLSELTNDVVAKTGLIMRSGGLTMMSMAVFCAMLARYGLRGVLDLRRPYRLGVLLLFVLVGLFGGFRSLLIQYVLIAAILFALEGLFRTRLFPMLILCMIPCVALVAGFSSHLPLSIQRSLAFLPLDIDPAVKMDADYSTQWRLQMWRDVIPDIPRYLLLGKGYGFNANDVDIARMRANTATTSSTESFELVGDYHNGPLSVILPFGIFGVIAFLWFLLSATRALYRNYKFGNPEQATLNNFLFAFFLAKLIFFLTIFGSFYVDLVTFAGVVGLSVSVNGGIAAPAAEPVPEEVASRFRLSPVVRRPVNA